MYECVRVVSVVLVHTRVSEYMNSYSLIYICIYLYVFVYTCGIASTC